MVVAWLRAALIALIEARERQELHVITYATHKQGLLERLQHIPSAGEALNWEGDQFTVLTMDGPRIEDVKICLGERSNALIMSPQQD